MTSPPCAFAHRLFPDLRRRRSKHPVGPSTPDRGRTCPPRTALPSRRLGYERRPLEEQDVPVGNRSPRSAYLAVAGDLQPAPPRCDLNRIGSRGRRPTTPPPGTPGGPAMSMVLTLTLHLRCTLWRNRIIPTIPAGRSDDEIVNVSAMDTGPRGSCGTVRRPPQVHTPLALSVALTQGREIRVPTSALALAFSEPPLLHEGRDLLAKGWAHCTKALPARSTPDPPPVVPDPRAVPPGHASTAHSKEDHAPNH